MVSHLVRSPDGFLFTIISPYLREKDDSVSHLRGPELSKLSGWSGQDDYSGSPRGCHTLTLAGPELGDSFE